MPDIGNNAICINPLNLLENVPIGYTQNPLISVVRARRSPCKACMAGGIIGVVAVI
jgi:hypothetical protein